MMRPKPCAVLFMQGMMRSSGCAHLVAQRLLCGPTCFYGLTRQAWGADETVPAGEATNAADTVTTQRNPSLLLGAATLMLAACGSCLELGELTVSAARVGTPNENDPGCGRFRNLDLRLLIERLKAAP